MSKGHPGNMEGAKRKHVGVRSSASSSRKFYDFCEKLKTVCLELWVQF